MVVPLNEPENTNHAVSQNDDVSNEGSAERKDEVVTGSGEGSPAGWRCPAPFVKKTFEMVEDPDTDPVVSWSFERDSFVVWDPHVFSNAILPKYFKHSNFSSFIHQLNAYGFKKVYTDRWEFANEGFQGGKKHLLKNIKRRRRSKYNKLDQIQGSTKSARLVMDDEIEKLKNDISMLKLETLKLRQLHENTQIHLTNVEERVQSAESQQCQILVFLTKMAKNPSVIEQFMKTMKRKKELEVVEMGKRRRLIETNVDINGSLHQCCDQLETLQSDMNGSLTSLLSELSTNSSNFRTSVSNVSSLTSVYDVMSEKLMEESCVIDEEVKVHVSKMYIELQDLISKPVDRIGLVGETS